MWIVFLGVMLSLSYYALAHYNWKKKEPQIEVIKKVELGPNDVLMVKIGQTTHDSTPESIMRMMDKFQSVFPHNKVMLYEKDIEISIIKRVDK